MSRLANTVFLMRVRHTLEPNARAHQVHNFVLDKEIILKIMSQLYIEVLYDGMEDSIEKLQLTDENFTDLNGKHTYYADKIKPFLTKLYNLF